MGFFWNMDFFEEKPQLNQKVSLLKSVSYPFYPCSKKSVFHPKSDVPSKPEIG
jgi:hypothetical protein